MPEADDLRRRALNELPAAYALALRLRDHGVPRDLIAECLQIEPETVSPLLALAVAKLAAALELVDDPSV